jgi:glycosyltransferase involved in cell wall biosynthesis
LLVAIDEMEVGGSQRQIVHLLGGIDRTRWQPELVYFRNPSFLLDSLREQGIPVHHVPKRRALDPMFLYRLAQLMRKRRYDLVHAFSITAELWSLLASRLMSNPPPLVSSVRSLNLDAPRWQWRIKRHILRHSAATIANAQAAAEAAAGLASFPEERITVIGNGVPVPTAMEPGQRQALRESIGVPDGRVLGLFVGRLTPVKNLPCLLDALARLAPAERPWLALAGDGSEAEALLQRRERLGLDGDVALLGERTDATRLMQAADFLVLCSHQEGLSNAVIEAMVAGCPVLASSVGGNVELVQNEATGLLFASDDRADLADALERITSDGELRRRLAERAQSQALERYSVAALAAATERVYERCLGPRRPQPLRKVASAGLQR